MSPLARFRSFPEPARRFLAGAALVELAHVFPWVIQNLYVRSLGYAEDDVGRVLAAGALGILCATIPAAWLYERLGARLSLSLACVGAGAALVALAMSTSVPALAAFAFLNGAAFTLHIVVAAPFLIGVSSPEQRTHLFGADFAVHTVAAAVGSQLAGALAQWYADGFGLPDALALRGALITGGVASFLALFAYARLPRRAAGAPRGNPLVVLAPSRWHLWWRLSIPQLLIGLGAGLAIPFLNLYFRDRFALPEGAIGFWMACSSATMTVGVLFAPRLVGRYGLIPTTILSEALSIPFFFVLAFTTSYPVAAVAFVLRSAFMNMSHPLWRQLMMEITPVEWRSAVNGIGMLFWHLGWFVSVQFGGAMIERSAGVLGEGTDGYALPMLITIGTYVAAIATERALFWRWRDVGKVASAPRGSPASG